MCLSAHKRNYTCSWMTQHLQHLLTCCGGHICVDQLQLSPVWKRTWSLLTLPKCFLHFSFFNVKSSSFTLMPRHRMYLTGQRFDPSQTIVRFNWLKWLITSNSYFSHWFSFWNSLRLQDVSIIFLRPFCFLKTNTEKRYKLQLENH